MVTFSFIYYFCCSVFPYQDGEPGEGLQHSAPGVRLHAQRLPAPHPDLGPHGGKDCLLPALPALGVGGLGVGGLEGRG